MSILSKIKNTSLKLKFKQHKKKALVLILLFWFLIIGLYQTNKNMPAGTDFISKSFVVKSENVDFVYDLSFQNSESIIHEQNIFDTIINHINEAEHYILIDMFLFNGLLGNANDSYRPLSSDLSTAIINKKKSNPEIKIDLITDPINIVYGGTVSREIEQLKKAGVNVIVSNLKPLRDSNPLYSSMWRGIFQWLGNSTKTGWLANPFAKDAPKVSLRSYLSLLNFKANHRKVFIADNNNEMVSLISSANPHDGSSAHSNVALKITGDFWQSLWYSESAVAKMAKKELQSPPIFKNINTDNQEDNDISLELITEKKIKDSLLEAIKNTKKDDQITMAMFYLSERSIIKGLINAANRGTNVKIILDPNKDAFGYQKNGIPNRQVASELIKKSKNKIKIRWYNTNGEQFHSKITYIAHKNGPSRVILGSANLTRRNINNYNLETNVSVIAPSSSIFIQNISTYLNRIWDNKNHNTYTLDYSAYQDDTLWKYWVYRLQEATGLCSF